MIASLYPIFQHWSDGGSIWILSDLHFEDKDCLLMADYWIQPEEQIKIINKYVKKGDCFICLGDVGNVEWMSKIKARYKVLIMGNHDVGKTKYLKYFSEVYDGPLFISDKILLSHEPISLPFVFNIHGHDHNNKEKYLEGCKHLNLACNVCGFTPVNLKDLIKSGCLSNVESIHRKTINRATERKNKRLKVE